MKRFLAWVLLGVMAVSLPGCAAAPAETPTAPATEPVQTAPAATVLETQPTEADVLGGSLYLSVSSIQLSLVGDSEDIYLGVIPRELVSWESEDPSIIAVENGVLTATGVGSTTIRASYEDRSVTCTASCLAQTQEELDALDEQIISAPKRVPPQVDLTQSCTYFDNAAICGDSITYYLLQWESKTNYLGDMLFLCRGGISLNGLVNRYKNIYFRGKEVLLEDAVAQSGVERVYFLLGSNDVGDSHNRSVVFENWTTLISRIRQQSPEVEIVLMANTPEYDPDRFYRTRNDRIHAYNDSLRTFAADNGCLFLDLGGYYEDHYGRMPVSLNLDNYHMNEDGGMMWMQILRYYAQFEAEGGILK